MKPHKLYKHLVAPLFDGAWQRIVTGSVLDPIGHILSGGNSKRRKKHHNKHHHSQSEYYDEPEFIHEHELYINHGGPVIYPEHAAHPPCVHGGSELEYHQGFAGYPVPYIGQDLYHENDSDDEDFNHF